MIEWADEEERAARKEGMRRRRPSRAAVLREVRAFAGLALFCGICWLVAYMVKD